MEIMTVINSELFHGSHVSAIVTKINGELFHGSHVSAIVTKLNGELFQGSHVLTEIIIIISGFTVHTIVCDE